MGANGPDATKAARERGMEAGRHQARPRRCGPVTSPAARPLPGGPGGANGLEPVAGRQARGWGPGRLPRPLPSSALLRAPSSPGGPRKARPAVGRGNEDGLETSDSASRRRLGTQGTATKWMTWPGNAVFCGGAPDADRPDFRQLRGLLPQRFAALTDLRGKSTLGDPAAAALLPGNLDLPLSLQFPKQPVNRIPASAR